MFENPKGGRQAGNFTTNVPKILGRSVGRYFICPHYTDEYKTRLNVNVPNYYKHSTYQNGKKIK